MSVCVGIHTIRLLDAWAWLVISQPRIVLTKPVSGQNVRITGTHAVAIIFAIFALIVFFVVRYFLLRRQTKLARLNEQRAHDALAQSEARYRLLFANNPCPMWVYDFDTLAFVEVNDNALEQYGFTREEFLGMTVRDIHDVEDVPKLEAVIREIDYAAEGVYVSRHRKKDGTHIEVETRGRPLPISSRRLRLVVATDITERYAADMSVRKAESHARATW